MKTMKFCFFTIVELLVVISIIIILAGLLLPALKTARDTAKQIKCIGNMKQVGTAFSLYLNDFNCCYPPLYWGSVTSSEWRWGWPEFMASYLNLDLGDGGTAYAAMPNRPTVLYCPSRSWYQTNSYYGCSYGYNTKALGSANYSEYSGYGHSRPPYPTRATQIEEPSSQMSHIDVYYSDSSESYMKRGRWGAESIDYVNYRHKDGANLLFTDGHANKKSRSIVSNNGSTGYELYKDYPWNWFLKK